MSRWGRGVSGICLEEGKIHNVKFKFWIYHFNVGITIIDNILEHRLSNQ